MVTLSTLSNAARPSKNRKRVGRGIGSGTGKTCGRGHKGMGSRSGNNKRQGYEGGQFRTFMKLPIRGFSNVQFQRKLTAINLQQIDKMYTDGEVVSVETLRQRGFISGTCHGLKILGTGDLTKSVTIEADALSESAREKLVQAKISVSLKK